MPTANQLVKNPASGFANSCSRIWQNTADNTMENKTKYVFHLPCYMILGGKRISLTLNWYRNAHYMLLNKTKRAYFPTKIAPFKAKKIHVDYTLHLSPSRKTDFMNWVTVADKYFLDWLVGIGFLPDDNCANYGSMSASVIIDKALEESYIVAEVTVLTV